MTTDSLKLKSTSVATESNLARAHWNLSSLVSMSTSMWSAKTRLLLEETFRKFYLFQQSDPMPDFLYRASQLTDQIAVMNKAYSSSGITWVLASYVFY